MRDSDWRERGGLVNSRDGCGDVEGQGTILRLAERSALAQDFVTPNRVQTPPNIARLLQALDQFGFASLGLTEADFMRPQAVVQLGYPPARIDLLTNLDGVEFDACWQRRLLLPVAGVELPVIHLDDFRDNKRASGRAKDLADLESLGDSPPPQ